jgi:hypothetical protein
LTFVPSSESLEKLSASNFVANGSKIAIATTAATVANPLAQSPYGARWVAPTASPSAQLRAPSRCFEAPSLSA